MLDANDYSSHRNGIPTRSTGNQFGDTLGGPVVIPKLYNGRDRTFFIFDYQGTRTIQPISATSTVPTAAFRLTGYRLSFPQTRLRE